MKRFLILLLLSLFLMASSPVLIFAQQGILPKAERSTEDCKKLLREFTNKSDTDKQTQLTTAATQEELLGCAIRTGRISVKMLPFFITFLIRFAIALAGLVAVLFIVIGGYKYTVGGLIDDKESGKKTIIYAITGLVVSLLAWIIVNIIQVQLTR